MITNARESRLRAAGSLREHLESTLAERGFLVHAALRFRGGSGGADEVCVRAATDLRRGDVLLRVPDSAVLSLRAARDPALALHRTPKTAGDDDGDGYDDGDNDGDGRKGDSDGDGDGDDLGFDAGLEGVLRAVAARFGGLVARDCARRRAAARAAGVAADDEFAADDGAERMRHLRVAPEQAVMAVLVMRVLALRWIMAFGIMILSLTKMRVTAMCNACSC